MIGFMLKMLLGGAMQDKRGALDHILGIHDAKLKAVPDVVEPPPGAPPRNPFTTTVPIETHSMTNRTARERMKMAPIMLRLMSEMNKSAAFYQRPLESPGREAPAELFDDIERIATEHGATAVRYVTLTDDCLLGGLGVPHRNAIVYTVRMDKEKLDTAPSFECFLEVARGYLRLAVIGNHVTRHLRARGFAAYPGTALGGLTDYARVGERAGLGRIGYHGCLITPGDGALLRLNNIYTSIENLPEARTGTDAEDMSWVRDFCSMCRKCVRECPPGAIHDLPRVLDNGRVECIETTACLDYFSQNDGCAICIDVCPFSQTGFVELQRRFKGREDAPKFTVDVAA